MQIGEALYILRPAVYAWAKYAAITFLEKRHTGKAADNVTNVAAVADWNADPKGASRTSASSGRRYGPFDSAGTASSWAHIFALALSLAIELLSLQLSAISLEILRAEALLMANSYRGPGGHAGMGAGAGAAVGMLRQTPRAFDAQRQHRFDAELSRRKRALLLNFLRSPLFDRTTLPVLNTASRVLKYIPLLNSLPGYAKGIFSYLNETHFRSAGST
jgi:hypothetical protein